MVRGDRSVLHKVKVANNGVYVALSYAVREIGQLACKLRVMCSVHSLWNLVFNRGKISDVEHAVRSKIACWRLVLQKVEIRIIAWMRRMGATGWLSRMTISSGIDRFAAG